MLGFLDKMNDEEAQIIANNGVKGRNYKLENGAYTSLEKTTKTALRARGSCAVQHGHSGTKILCGKARIKAV